jgi:glyoxylase-like metal-dependent hydrolase (beta-lactamase superfamily II)
MILLQQVTQAEIKFLRISDFMFLSGGEPSKANRRCTCPSLLGAFGRCFGASLSHVLDWIARKHRCEICASLFLLIAATQCWASVQLTPIAPGVYVVLQQFADRFNDSNSTVVLMDDAVLVVDTQNTLTEARDEVEAIKHLTSKPVRWVINTHWHNDHVQGNQVYREAFPGVQFLAQVNTKRDMKLLATSELRERVESLPGQLNQYRQLLSDSARPGGTRLDENRRSVVEMRIRTFSKQLPDLRHTHIVLPDITFDTSTSLFSSAREIRLTHYLGHTEGDVVVFLPDDKILITGDLLDDMPYTGDGSPKGLAETLHRLDALNFDFVIPGHGGIEKGHDHLRLIASLFESIISQVQEDVANGLSLSDAEKSVDVIGFRELVTGGEEHATRAFDAFVPVAIERAYKEAKGDVK